ncbi:hypothetical protein BN159_1283 [Streptomyces davaonensis JCM 4913]|uniref:Uncharacterized protein n=1 Tax=Streptomyces davaonensis (strain DSM 101723 / JCM 4913 / KCC S-0913 / 768) TaxID=1214101 RepID=K4QXK8_STRDJ|nr:hypothetical protein [Streptomyces davaonensis]CCK25662.1 hypothetical protein BN159_1283 [Streptomyces davaonensis JCM 4913]
MGYWGYFTVAESASPLGDLACTRAIPELTLNRRLSGDWQVWEHPAEPDIEADDLAVALAEETGKPALVGFVMDSDCVVIEAADSSNGAWTACLSPKAMARYLAEDGQQLEDWMLTPERATENAVIWARLTGRQVATAPLAEIFQKEADPFAEDLFFTLLRNLSLV